MVKRKSLPKPRLEAGHAARTSQLVNDTTISEDSSDNLPKTSTATTKKTKIIKKKEALFASKKNFVNQGGTALKEIKRLQSTTNLLIPRAPFLRLVKEIIYSSGRSDYKVTEMAVEALRESSECVLTNLFEDAYLLAIHAKRVTLFPSDMALALNLRKDGLSSRS